jgi:hypothetical protein
LNEWDNQLISTVGDKHLLGVSSFRGKQYTSVTPMWDAEDLLEGIRFLVTIGDQTITDTIEPMSNVDRWTPSVIAKGLGLVKILSLTG